MIISLMHWLLTSVAHAADVSDLGKDAPGVSAMWASLQNLFPHTDLGTYAPIYFMIRIARFVLSMIGVVAVCVIVYAGIKATTSAGDDGKLTEAKTTIMYALGGVALALWADVIMYYVCTVMIPAIAGGASTACPVLW